MRKKYIFYMLISFFFIICIVSGCSQSIKTDGIDAQNTIGTDSIIDTHDDQYFFAKSLGADPSMVMSESGNYFFSGSQNYYIYFTDKKSMRTVPLCNKPDCLHDNETNISKSNSCNSYVRGDYTKMVGDLLLYENQLYFFRIRKENDKPIQYLLTQISIDGSMRDDVYDFIDFPQFIIIHRGFLYYSTTDNGTVDDKEDSTVSETRLYRIPLEHLDNKPEIIYSSKGIYAIIGGLLGYDKNIYFTYEYFADPKLQQYENSLMSYNIDNDKVSMISDKGGRVAICNNKIVYYLTNDKKCLCELDGSNSKILDSIVGIQYSDDQFILTDTKFMKTASSLNGDNKAEKQFLHIYNLNGKKLQSFDLDKYVRATVFGSDNRYIYLTTTSQKNENCFIHQYWRIDKSRITGGKAKMEEYFNMSEQIEP